MKLDRLEDVLGESGQTDQSPAWIFGASVNGLSFARSLGRRGIRCVIIDSEKLVGSFTRYAAPCEVEIGQLDTEEGVAALVRAAGLCKHKPVIFATSDAHNLMLARWRAELDPHVHLCVPDFNTVDNITNKRKQYAVATAADIEIPKTIYPSTPSDAERCVRDIGLPLIVKPYMAHSGRKAIGGKKIALIKSAAELRELFDKLGQHLSEFMVQEIIPGGDSALYGYLAFWGRREGELAWVTKQKLRQNPPIYGDGSHQKTTRFPGLRETSIRLLDAFDYHGFVGVEYKLDPRDGRLKLMEINPRTVSGNQMAIAAGVDFPFIGYRYAIDGAAPQSSFRVETTYVNEEWDLHAYLALRKQGGMTLLDYLTTFISADARAIWAIDDWGPTLEIIRRILSGAFGRIRNGFRAR